jgi:Family of unknown function (DUF5989)
MMIMSETTPPMGSELEKSQSEFEKAATQSQEESLVTELWSFLAQNKKWWLMPIVIVMLLLGTLFWLSAGAATPFIYTLF